MESKVFSGAKLFFLVATHGLPLDVAIGKIHNTGLHIDWPGFIDAALENGWSVKRINLAVTGAIREAIEDEEFCTETLVRLKLYLLNKMGLLP